jgi:hypothetical protein
LTLGTEGRTARGQGSDAQLAVKEAAQGTVAGAARVDYPPGATGDSQGSERVPWWKRVFGG